MAEGLHFLVRHGAYEDDVLTTEGIRQSEAARDHLVGLGLGGVLLLSSDLPRAMQTAGIIADGLQIPVHASHRLNVAGNHAEVVEDLDVFLAETLRQLGLERALGQSLVIVAHAPMLGIVKGTRPGGVRNGEVVPYARGTWNGSSYMRRLAERYASELTENRP